MSIITIVLEQLNIILLCCNLPYCLSEKQIMDDQQLADMDYQQLVAESVELDVILKKNNKIIDGKVQY